MPKYKLAEYRYGREEMLALYIKDNKVRSENPNCRTKHAPCPFGLAFCRKVAYFCRPKIQILIFLFYF